MAVQTSVHIDNELLLRVFVSLKYYNMFILELSI